MSNPGVRALASLKPVGVPWRFEIEDNVGEAIHVHYRDIRLDLTIKEFYALAEKAEKCINSLVSNRADRDVEGFSASDFDPVNLVGLAGILPDIERITYDEVYLEDLLVDTTDPVLPEPSEKYRGGYSSNMEISTKADQNGEFIRPLPESRIVKALNGRTHENDVRSQVNYYDGATGSVLSNEERLEYNLQKIKEEGYPGKSGNSLITLFNDSNRIYDGQHRAGCLYYLNGNIKVKVRRLWFKNFHSSDDSNVGANETSYEMQPEIRIHKDSGVRSITVDLSTLNLDNSYSVKVREA